MCPQVLLFGRHTWCGRRCGGSSKSQSSAKFKEISSNFTARGESYRTKGKILKACVQSLLTYETETWSMKKANLQSLERNKKMMVIWMGRKRSVDSYSLLGVQSVADVVRHDRFRWLGHLERIGVWNPCG